MSDVGTLKPALFASGSVVVAIALTTALLRPPAIAATRICSAPHGAAAKTGYGTVHFANSCSAAIQPMLQLEIAKLHSFEADAKGFAALGTRDPSCAVAWWGAAMSARGNPLGGSLDAASLASGRRFVDIALAVKSATPRERGLIEAMDVYYKSYPDQIARARAYSLRMDALLTAYPDDPDIAAFDGLSIIEGVYLEDKTYARQKRAAAILEQVMRDHPDHPGAPHYLIHADDYTALAARAVHAAEVYPRLAPASSHAQHMPSHIWSMLGAWDRSIDANRASSYLADPSSDHDRVKGDIVFEHAFDFIAYARLQRGEDRHVAEDLKALGSAAPLIVRARFALERGDWAAAAALPVPDDDAFDAALARFARAYGAARAGHAAEAASEIWALKALRPAVVEGAGEYWGVFVDIYAKAAEAWRLEALGKSSDALALMEQAATQDDGHEKHIYLENKILPMRESLGDMQLALGHPREALVAYRASLILAPNRYRSLLGAATAAEASGDKTAARDWWEALVKLLQAGDKTRPGFAEAKARLAGNG